ncbi:hypothetical protein V8G54_029554 [Vigna mungo]|uniref:Uncharacterized protein n=1 Tax=Vigna mungo TaxID=3915 RepID=A0AAQ3MUY0_VIGMU
MKHVINLSLPIPHHLSLLLPPPIQMGNKLRLSNINTRPIHISLRHQRNFMINLSFRWLRTSSLQSIGNLLLLMSKRQQRTRWQVQIPILGSITLSEKQKGLVGTLDAEAVEASEGHISAEVGTAFPNSVGVRRGNAANEGNDGALEMKRYLHVEVADSSGGSHNAGKSAAPFGPRKRLVVARDDHRDGFLSSAHGFLERTPTLLVLKTPIRTGTHENLRGDSVSETHREVERGFSSRHVAAVDNRRHPVSFELRRERFGFCVDLTSFGESRNGGNEVAQCGVVTPRYCHVCRTVRVFRYILHQICLSVSMLLLL